MANKQSDSQEAILRGLRVSPGVPPPSVATGSARTREARESSGPRRARRPRVQGKPGK